MRERDYIIVLYIGILVFACVLARDIPSGTKVYRNFWEGCLFYYGRKAWREEQGKNKTLPNDVNDTHTLIAVQVKHKPYIRHFRIVTVTIVDYHRCSPLDDVYCSRVDEGRN